MHNPRYITPNPWKNVRDHTPARIALGHCGGSLPTSELLQFQADHASARDAVHSMAEFEQIAQMIKEEIERECIQVYSAATSRPEYLRRPDLGRKLESKSRENLLDWEGKNSLVTYVVADGLSATAINLHAVSLLKEIHSFAGTKKQNHSIILAKEARVALGDEIGEILHSSIVVMLIGERPGLSNAESIGAYITYAPRVGRTDAERNCISNICPDGLPFEEAAKQIIHLTNAALHYQLTGVELSRKLSSHREIQKDGADSSPKSAT